MVFKDFVQTWVDRYFSDRQAIVLALLLLVGFGVIITMGGTLAPVLASLVVAYLLETMVQGLHRRAHVGRLPAVLLVYLLFLGFLGVLAFVVLPLMWNQIGQFAKELPSIVNDLKSALMQLPERYPSYFSPAQVEEISSTAQHELGKLGQTLLSHSLASLPGLITLMVYLVLLPLLVFFFLKDKGVLIGWVGNYLPRERHLAGTVWREMEQQVGNYVRGKVVEVLFVGLATFIAFVLLDVKYAVMLSVIVGLSVIVPYVGATVVTIPVVLAAYFQFGWGSEFGWVVVAYGVIQALDGNWGVFFAIPLATLVKTLLNVWPGLRQEAEGADSVAVPEEAAAV